MQKKKRIYSLKSGKKIAFANNPRPREGEVVFFTFDEWRWMKEHKFTDRHKDYIWEQKHRDFRYRFLPEKGLTEPETANRICSEIIEELQNKKKEPP